MSAANWIIVVEFGVFMLALIGFVIGYTLSSRGRWADSAEGRHLVSFRSALALWGLMGVVHGLTPDYAGQDLVRVTVVGLVSLTALHGCYIMARAQLATRRRIAARRAQQAADADR